MSKKLKYERSTENKIKLSFIKAVKIFSGLGLFALFFCVLFFSELILRISSSEPFFGEGILHIFTFSIPFSFSITFICKLLPKTVSRIFCVFSLVLLLVLYCLQIVYYKIFQTYCTVYSVFKGTDALGFWKQTLPAIANNFVFILSVLFLCGIAVFFVFKLKFERSAKASLKPLSLSLLTYCAAVSCLFFFGTGFSSSVDYYFNGTSLENSVYKLGCVNSIRLNAQHMLFGTVKFFDLTDSIPVDKPVEVPVEENENDEASKPTLDESPNIINIDFDSLIANEKDSNISKMHAYFKDTAQTLKNEYTGIYKGYNLIHITAESFSPYVVDEKLTPTLYKMANNGYNFTNFYNPGWGVSTSDGEYVNCLGLIPKSGVWSMFQSGTHVLPFALGNQFKSLGYAANAYHNNTYTYYDRHISHPALGYTYKAVGNGLNIKKTWPQSDLEMIDVSSKEYISDKPFHTYYMTVSGHMLYSWTGNYMSSKHKELVKDLPYSEECKAYLACNIELDRAMALLLERLKEAGVAEKTVIALSSDHYPYGLTNRQISEFLGHEVEENFERYKSTFILYVEGMTPTVVDKPCSSLDILPTLSNMFGLEYDSRLLMGKDIFSTSPPLVIFVNRSFITDRVMYNSKTKKATQTGGLEADDDYIKAVNQTLAQKFSNSEKIVTYDYYRYVFGDKKE